MGRFIRIAATEPVTVNCGIKVLNVTNQNGQGPNRLAVQGLWVDTSVSIKKGIGFYPSVIKNYPVVKALSKSNLLNIGEETDTCDNQAEVEAICERVEAALANIEAAENANKKKASQPKKQVSEELF